MKGEKYKVENAWGLGEVVLGLGLGRCNLETLWGSYEK